ncbi:MAG: hypothetical protein IPH76_11815 [Xanthomonadales bacterium]|nr:hypothetical protein [Xanthomonadales bacterium]
MRASLEALALIDALLAQMPRCRACAGCSGCTCSEAALARGAEAEREAQALAVAIEAPKRSCVDAALFNVEQQVHVQAAAAELGRSACCRWSMPHPRHSQVEPGASADPLQRRRLRRRACRGFAAVPRQLPARLLACVSAFDDGSFRLTHRDGELAIASTDQVAIRTLPRTPASPNW